MMAVAILILMAIWTMLTFGGAAENFIWLLGGWAVGGILLFGVFVWETKTGRYKKPTTTVPAGRTQR